MVGKTIASLEIGHRRKIPKVHQSELIVIHFTDGSTLAIDTGSNVQNVMRGGGKKPDDIHVDFYLEWFESTA